MGEIDQLVVRLERQQAVSPDSLFQALTIHRRKGSFG